jgi:hypothetical protein
MSLLLVSASIGLVVGLAFIYFSPVRLSTGVRPISMNAFVAVGSVLVAIRYAGFWVRYFQKEYFWIGAALAAIIFVTILRGITVWIFGKAPVR